MKRHLITAGLALAALTSVPAGAMAAGPETVGTLACRLGDGYGTVATFGPGPIGEVVPELLAALRSLPEPCGEDGYGVITVPGANVVFPSPGYVNNRAGR